MTSACLSQTNTNFLKDFNLMLSTFVNLSQEIKIFFDNKVYGKKVVTASFYDENDKLVMLQEIRVKNWRNIERIKRK